MHRIFFIMIFGCIAALHSYAQDTRYEYTDTSILKGSTGTQVDIVLEEKDILSDTTVYIHKINISPDTIAAWKNNRQFAWLKNIDSLLKQQQQQIRDDFKSSHQKSPDNFLRRLFSSGILSVLFWTIAIAFVLFILYKLFLSNGIFKRTATTVPVHEVPEEELAASVENYDKLIQQSVAKGDHRLAVRYLFLKTLVHLTDKEYLHHAADKTNYQYVQEIRADRKNEFASLVLNYEYIWYGNFPLNAASYTGIEKKFNSFYNKIL